MLYNKNLGAVTREKCSTASATRGIQTETMRQHFTQTETVRQHFTRPRGPALKTDCAKHSQ